MPTAAKLIAAVFFAGLAFLVAEIYKPLLPEETQFGAFSEICAALGFACGWLVMGTKTGMGRSGAMSAGIQTSVTFVFFALLGFSIYLMVKRSIRMMYGDPMEAVIGIFELMMKYGAYLLNPQVIAMVLLGGIVGGMLTEWASRRWS